MSRQLDSQGFKGLLTYLLPSSLSSLTALSTVPAVRSPKLITRLCIVAMQRRELHNKKGKMDDSINVGFFTLLCNQLHDCMGEVGRWVAWLWMQLWMIPRESHGLEKRTALPAMTLRLKGLFNYACKYARAFRKLVRKTRPFARKFWVDISTLCS